MSTMADFIQNSMKNGYNCCESIILASDQRWDLQLSSDFVQAGKYFGHGLNSGCTCGALAGIVLVSGILNGRKGGGAHKHLGKTLHQKFVEQNGSSCCRVLRQQQGVLERIGNKGCCTITQKAMQILEEVWAE